MSDLEMGECILQLGEYWQNRRNDQIMIEQTRAAIKHSRDLLSKTANRMYGDLTNCLSPRNAIDQPYPVAAELEGGVASNPAAQTP